VLKPLIVDMSRHGTQQLVCEPYSSDDGDDNKPQDSKPVNINEKQKVESNNGGKTDTNSLPPVIRDVIECEDSSNDKQGTTNAESKEESTTASPINQNEDLMDTRRNFLLNILLCLSNTYRETLMIKQTPYFIIHILR
jgi:hypothetical protein